jgi:hypothetical protein
MSEIQVTILGVMCKEQLKLSMSTQVLGGLSFDTDACVKRKVGREHWSFPALHSLLHETGRSGCTNYVAHKFTWL